MYLPILTTFPRIRIINFAVTPTDLFRLISYAKQNVWIWATTAIEVFFFKIYRLKWKQISTRDKRFIHKILFPTQIIRLWKRKRSKYVSFKQPSKTPSGSYKCTLEVIGCDRVFHDIANTPDSKRVGRNQIIQESDTKKNGNIKYNLDF